MREIDARLYGLFAILLYVCGVLPTNTGMPCIYEAHLKTDKDWYGYLANITIMSTGRMSFEFSYPADKCCQNVLFYLEDQMSILNARMNCWQKEALLRPEDDQILRLTPRFSWSGCHMTYPNGIATYQCEGGRSFTSTSNGDKPTTWYIAVSNCASLMGLELKYRLEIIGHVGECKSAYRILTTPDPYHEPTPKGVVSRETVVHDKDKPKEKSCIVEGTLNVTTQWHGYLANVTLGSGGGFRFTFTYPYNKQVQNVILYNEEDIEKLHSEQSCWQKEGVIRSRHVPDQILDLSFRSSWNGCVSSNTSQGNMLVCKGERRYNTPRKLFIALNNCRTRDGLYLKYRIEVTGYEGNLCSSSQRTHHQLSFLSISLAVILVLYITEYLDIRFNR